MLSFTSKFQRRKDEQILITGNLILGIWDESPYFGMRNLSCGLKLCLILSPSVFRAFYE